MKRISIHNNSKGTVLGDNIQVADKWFLRLRGMLWRPPPAKGEGMLLTPCKAVHMFGMPYALDILFLDRDYRVVKIVRNLYPGETSGRVKDSVFVIELPCGTIEDSMTQVGDEIIRGPC